MRRVVDVAAEVLRFEDCSLFVLDGDKNELILQASRGGLVDRVGEATYPLGEGLTGWVGQHGEVIRTGSPKADPRWRGRFEEFPSEDIGAFLAVPIFGRHGVLGVLRVLRRKSVAPWFRREFTDDDESVLLTIASQLGTAIENGRILDRLVNTERMAAWGEMSARAAHMIGNRTFAIKGDLNELEYRLSEPDDRRDEFRGLAEGIRRGIFRLEEILQEFRDFVRATQIALTKCDLNEIVQQCVHESFPKRSGRHADSRPGARPPPGPGRPGPPQARLLGADRERRVLPPGRRRADHPHRPRRDWPMPSGSPACPAPAPSCRSSFRTTAPASPPTSRTASSPPSTPPARAAWAWASASSRASWRPTGAASPRSAPPARAPTSSPSSPPRPTDDNR